MIREFNTEFDLKFIIVESQKSDYLEILTRWAI